MGHRALAGKSVRICRPEDSLSEAAEIMLTEECGCLLVRAHGEGDRVAGVITDRDICMAAYRSEKELRALRVEDAMSTEVAGFGLREALAAAGVATDHNESRPLALLDEQGELLAIVSLIPLDGGNGTAPRRGKRFD